MAVSNPSRPDPPSAREAAVAIAVTLRDAGFQSFFAGGCVRDRLMGHEPDDYDVVTNARPEQVQEVFPRAYGVGEAFGVMLVRKYGHVVEVATFRSDGAYSDARRPDRVEFTDAQTDAQRRDFTINGLFEDPLSGDVIDYVGGRDDLAAGIIRAIGDPVRRFSEDRLRMVRAVRFAARFGFQIELMTAAAISAGASDLRGISRERVGHELRRMFETSSRATAARMLQELRLDGSVLGERPQNPPLVAFGALPTRAAFGACLAAWMVDREATQECVRERSELWCGSLILSNTEQKELIETLNLYFELIGIWENLPVAQRRRRLAKREWEAAFAMVRGTTPQLASVIGQDADKYRTNSIVSMTPLIDGDDLIHAGFRPGPIFRQALDEIYDAQLEGRVTNHADALELAKSIFARTKG